MLTRSHDCTPEEDTPAKIYFFSSLSENFAKDLEMFARWVERLCDLRSADISVRIWWCILGFLFSGGLCLIMMLQGINICSEHVTSDQLGISEFFAGLQVTQLPLTENCIPRTLPVCGCLF